MKQDKRWDKTTKPVKCRFPQKFRCPAPTSFPAAAAVSTSTCEVVTRKVSGDDLDSPPPPPPPPPSEGGPKDIHPQSPLSVVTNVDMLVTSAAPDGLSSESFSPGSFLSRVESSTIRSVSDSSLEHGMEQQQPSLSSSGFLKRRAKSMCLTELAPPPTGPAAADSFVPNGTNQQQEPRQHPDVTASLACEPSSPGRSASTAAAMGAWGLFVDLDEHHQVALFVDRDRRRPLRYRRRAPLKGFILPDIDEATSQLGNLSF